MPQIFLTALLLVMLAARAVAAVNVLVEAESFAVKGGWRVDPQPAVHATDGLTLPAGAWR